MLAGEEAITYNILFDSLWSGSDQLLGEFLRTIKLSVFQITRHEREIKRERDRLTDCAGRIARSSAGNE